MTRKQMRDQLYRMLFQLDFHQSDELKEQVSLFLEDLTDISDADKAELQAKFEGAAEKVEQLDALIDEKSSGWSVKRLAKADLTVLRLALYEILYDEKVPDGVALNEAVELAKKYGEDKSSRFVNGVLASIVRERSQSDGENA
ncbi:MAG: transcription antitermination factor NusB [Lachnospiraceae bacterium]|nr:transcription antitermination factor NusB [Lachnospiraceae bacterium]